jgi:hypothetical protein
MEETELRERLEYIAVRTAPPLQDPGDLAASVVDRHRSARRRQATLVAALAVVLLLVPGLRFLTSAEPEPAAPPTESVETVEIFTLPTRGSLADDTALMADIRRLPWVLEGGPPGAETRVANRHVVWAGDSDAGRWALVVGVTSGSAELTDESSPLAAAWFIGPRGAAAEEMSMRSLVHVNREEPTALWDPVRGATVVVAAPDDRIEVSPRVQIAAAGTVHRTFEELPARNGVGVFFDRVEGLPAVGQTAQRYRVLRGGSWVTFPPNSTLFVPPEPLGPVTAVPMDRLRAAPPAHPGDAAAPTLIEDLLIRTGLPPDQLVATVLWAGDLPSVVSESARATAMAVRLPSGAIYVGGILGQEGIEGPFGVLCGSELRAAAPVEQLVVVLHCSSAPPADPPDAGERLIVVGPPEATTARVLDAQGQVLGSNPMVDGVAVVPMLDDLATVEVLDAGGDILDARAPMGVADLSGD